MKLNKQQIEERVHGAVHCEAYRLINKNGVIHTDNLIDVEGCEAMVGVTDFLPYDKNGEIDVDVHVMDKEDYESTVLANCGETWEDFGLDNDDRIAVIIVND